MEQAFKHSDVFLTHTWRHDLHGRDNHARVSAVNVQLNRRGFLTWFDSQRMEGKIKDKMAEGIDFTKCVLVFVSEAYMNKLDSGNTEDNCLFEFERALKQKSKFILCVVMENKYTDPRAWFGRLKKELGDGLFMDLSGDLNNQLYLKQKMDELVEHLKLKSVSPSQVRMVCPKCVVSDEENNKYLFHNEFEFCTICGNHLQPLELRNYCEKCNYHSDGRYCNKCANDLLDPQIKIVEAEDLYLKQMALKERTDSAKFSVLAENYKENINKIKHELKDIFQKRDRLQNDGTRLQMSDIECTKKTKALEEEVDRLQKISTSLPGIADKCCELEPVFEAEIQMLHETMKSLSGKRNEISQRTSELTQGFNECVETLASITNKMVDLKMTFILEQPIDLPNSSHERLCQCEICSFENEVLAQWRLDGGKQFLQTLVVENRLSDLKLAIRFKEEMLQQPSDDEEETLVMFTIKHGTADILSFILDQLVKSDYTPKDGILELLNEVNDPDMAHVILNKYSEPVSIRNASMRNILVNAKKDNNDPLVEVLKSFLNTQEVETVAEEADIRFISDLIREDDHELLRIMNLNEEAIRRQQNNNYKYTPLLLCSANGTLAAWKALEENNSNINRRDVYGRTALHLAVDNAAHGVRIVEYICCNYPHLLDVEDNCGSSIFHYVVYNSEKERVARTLLQHNPRPQLLKKVDLRGHSPISQAKVKRMHSIVRMFEEYMKGDGIWNELDKEDADKASQEDSVGANFNGCFCFQFRSRR